MQNHLHHSLMRRLSGRQSLQVDCFQRGGALDKK